jgi:hypothetical protein
VAEPCSTSTLAAASARTCDSLTLAVAGRDAYPQAGYHAGIAAIERMPWAGVTVAPD